MLMGQSKESINLWKIEGISYGNVQEFYEVADSALAALISVKESTAFLLSNMKFLLNDEVAILHPSS